jgi:hypothetical protein
MSHAASIVSAITFAGPATLTEPARVPASGFRLLDDTAEPVRRTLRLVESSFSTLPLVLGPGDATPVALPACRPAEPDQSLLWLGLLACWMSSFLTLSLLVLALR